MIDCSVSGVCRQIQPTAHSTVRFLHRGSTTNTLVFYPSLVGGLLGYRHLIRSLASSPDCPTLIGIELPSRRPMSIKEVADEQSATMKLFFENDSVDFNAVFFVGASFGAILAYEVAQRTDFRPHAVISIDGIANSAEVNSQLTFAEHRDQLQPAFDSMAVDEQTQSEVVDDSWHLLQLSIQHTLDFESAANFNRFVLLSTNRFQDYGWYSKATMRIVHLDSDHWTMLNEEEAPKVAFYITIMTNNLKGKVALVSGGSRGIGKGIAVELAIAGATVYVTSRPNKSRDVVKSAGTLDELINEVKEKNGTGKIVPVFCDHTNESDVKSLFEQIEREQNGQLDLLVNNAVANVLYTVKNSGVPFYELKDDPAYTYDIYNNCGLRGYYICSTYAARLMVPRKSGLIVTIGSPGSVKHLFSVLYGVQKEANDRMISEMAIELKDTGVLAIALHPGPVETETFKEHVGDKWMFAGAETIYFAGRCLVKLLGDLSYVKERNGQVLLTSDLSERYDIKDLNDKQVKHDSQQQLRPLYEAMDKLHTHELHSSTQ